MVKQQNSIENMLQQITQRLDKFAKGLLQGKHDLQLILTIENIDTSLKAESHSTIESYTKSRNYVKHPANAARSGSAVKIKNNIKH